MSAPLHGDLRDASTSSGRSPPPAAPTFAPLPGDRGDSQIFRSTQTGGDVALEFTAPGVRVTRPRRPASIGIITGPPAP